MTPQPTTASSLRAPLPDGILQQTGESHRDRSRAALYRALNGSASESDTDTAARTAESIETHLFHIHNDTPNQDYLDDVKTHVYNLKVKGNEGLREGVKSGDVECGAFARMSSE
ncbi:hypothetical protein HK104_006602, partial [Borealophlyctis nickersoniae]